MSDWLRVAALVATWGTLIVVWVAGAAYNARHAPRERVRAGRRPAWLLGGSILVTAIAVTAGRLATRTLTTDAPAVRILGLAILIAGTAFALWARVSLGTSWSINPEVGGDRRLRTNGPYAITRHPIYTGIVAMLVGTALLAGLGQWIALALAGVVGVEIKIRLEEDLLEDVFPDEYPRYRERVPQLIPGLRLPRRG